MLKKELLFVDKIYLRNLNLIGKLICNESNLFIKVRSTGQLIKAKIKTNNNSAEVILMENEKGVSPGQACVFYLKEKIGEKVLGGGWIDRTDNKYSSTLSTNT